MALTSHQVELLAKQWSRPELAKGKLVRTGEPSASFWSYWRSPWKRKTLFSSGVSARQDGETHKWALTWSVVAPEDWKPEVHTAKPAEPVASPEDDQWVATERAKILKAAAPINELGLLGYQVPSVKLLVNAIATVGGAIDASDPGVGKSYTSLGVVREFDGWRPAVVCPKPVIPPWGRVAKHLGVDPVFVLNYEQIRNGRTAWGRWLGNPKKDAAFEWTLPASTMLILDEAHICKNPLSRASRLLTAATRQGIPTVALSATLAANPTELYAVGLLLGLHKGVDFFEWCAANECFHDGVGWQYRGGPLGMLKLHRQIFPHKGARIRLEDLGPAFPDSLISTEAFDTGNEVEIQKVYDEMHQELEELEAKGAKDKPGVLVAMLRARQRAELLKVPLVADMAVDLREQGKQVAIFVNFTETLVALSERLSCQCIVWGGNKKTKASGDERQRNIDAFQNGSQPIILCNAQAGGVGIGLHGKNRAALVLPGYSAILLRQVLGRVRRQGGAKSIQRIIFAAKTIEEAACRAVQRKLDNMAALNDGDLKAGLQI